MNVPLQYAQTQAQGLSKADEEQLDLLGILYFAYGGVIALAGLMFGVFALIPVLMIAGAPDQSGGQAGPPPALVGGIFLLAFGAVTLLLLAKAFAMIMVGRALRRRTSWMLCMIGAALAVMNIPLGTALAVFTFIMLNKPAAKARFGAA